METITKPSITRLARKAGVKSLSDDCHQTVRNIMREMVLEIGTAALVVNSERGTKTLMVEDAYDALHLLGNNVTQSDKLGTSTVSK